MFTHKNYSTKRIVKASFVSEPASDPENLTGLLSADAILTTSWPEPRWVIPGLIPSGLTILAGVPKIGKSWLSLQLAQTVATGGFAFNQKVEQGSVLYLALEDPYRRLQERMTKQKWPLGTDAAFLPLGGFQDVYGDLRNGGGEKLTNQILKRGFRLVVIDTFSRVIFGDQNDVVEMTEWMTPLQEIAHSQDSAIILVDHHKKRGDLDHDVIADVLGSTGKGAVADTIIGLYRERGKAGAKLAITGRDVEEKTINVYFDTTSGCWQVDTSQEDISDDDQQLIAILEELGCAGDTQIAKKCDPERLPGTVHKQLARLEQKGLVRKSSDKWELVHSLSSV